MKLVPLIILSVMMLVSGDEFAFFDSCADGDVESLKVAMESGNIDVNYPDENGNTPLILSAKNGHTDIVGALLDAGADIELAAEYPAQVDTPLSAAAQNEHMETVKLLLSRGAKVDGRGRDGRSALMAAAAKGKTSMVKYLLGKGAEVDAIKFDGTSALYWAGFEGHADTVVFLLGEGAKVDRTDYVDGSQPIHLAVQNVNNGTREVLSHLITFGADPNARTGVVGQREADGTLKENPKREELQGGRTPLMLAAAGGNVAAVEFLSEGRLGSSTSKADLIDAVEVQGNTAVALAALQGKVKVLSTLISAGADLNVPNANALAPLHHAAYSGHLECVRRLIKGGAVVDQPSALVNGVGQGHTPLLLAAAQGHAKVVRLLIKAGAQPDRPAKDGATPLIAAASGGHRKTVKALLKRGANPRARLFESGETAAMLTSDRSVGKLLYFAELEARMKEVEAEGGGPTVDEEEAEEVVGEVNLDEEDEEEEEEEEEDEISDEVFDQWITQNLGEEL